MNTYRALKHWRRKAGPRERGVAAAIWLMVAGLLAWGLLPPEQALHSTAAPAASAPQQDPLETPGVGHADMPPAVADEPGTRSDLGGETAAEADAEASQPIVVPGDQSPPQPAPVESAPGCDEPRSASDRGVTPDHVVVGFGIIDVTGSGLGNEAFGLRRDVPEAIDAFVDAVNRQGGIACRAVVARKYRVNVLDSNDGRRKCLQAAEDGVFAFIDSVTMSAPAARACFPVEHEIPYVGVPNMTDANVQDAHPYLVSPFSTSSRAVRDWARAAKEERFFDPAAGFRKLGLLLTECMPELNDDLLAVLGEVGVRQEQISQFTLSCSTANPPSETLAAALRHKADGATHVFVAAAPLSVGSYLRAASAQAFFPQYGASDAYLITTNAVAQNFDAAQWDGARATTSGTDGLFGAGMDPTVGMQRCSGMLEDHGLPRLDEDSAELAALCDGLTLLVEAGNVASGPLARPSWAAAVSRVGTVHFATTPVGIYDRSEKVTGGDMVASIEWRRGCRCWVQTGPFREGYE